MVYRSGKFAFDDTPDRGATDRAKHLALPATARKCRTGEHVFSEYVESFRQDGKAMIRARCPDCKETFTFAAHARDR